MRSPSGEVKRVRKTGEGRLVEKKYFWGRTAGSGSEERGRPLSETFANEKTSREHTLT